MSQKSERKKVYKQAAQGDVLFWRSGRKLPKDATPAATKGARIVVAHSETGHHHTVGSVGTTLYNTPNPLLSFLLVEDETDVVHLRESPKPHAAFTLTKGLWEIRRQHEETKIGRRAVMD